MRTKLRSKKGVTLTEVIITLVVSSIFFVMVGSIIVAYRNVTNTAINTTSATSAATLVSNSFEKMTNFCNSSEDNHLYYKRNADDTFVFYVYQGNGTPTKEDLEGNEIEVNDGNTFIQICPIDSKVVIEPGKPEVVETTNVVNE